MSFTKIIGQEQVLSLFKNALQNERLAHAYIFAGQEGIGKMLFARELAKKIFCQSGKIDGACDNCNICKRIDADNFTDIFFLLPEKNHRVIKLEQLKYLQEILFVKPLESKHKIVIVEDADHNHLCTGIFQATDLAPGNVPTPDHHTFFIVNIDLRRVIFRHIFSAIKPIPRLQLNLRTFPFFL